MHVNGVKASHTLKGVGETAAKKDNPQFDAKLVPGVNRVDVELLAASEARKGKAEEVLRETCTVFVNLLRA